MEMAELEGIGRGPSYLIVMLIAVMPSMLADDSHSCSPLTAAEISAFYGEAPPRAYTILRPTLNDTSKWVEMFETAPLAYLSPEVKYKPGSGQGEHMTLLGTMNYTPSDRDQGTCGNCWSWAGTGILEIALHSQLGIRDRLSVQYVNSNYNGGGGSNWSCCGGWLEDLTRFYNRSKTIVPWSNENGSWQDRFKSCGTETNVPSGSISLHPHYTLDSVRTVSIPTWGLEKEQAISNIKNVLGQGKGIWFGFFLPNQTAWTEFFNFWGYQPECAIWQPADCTAAYNFNNGGGHAVLCVGYNDRDPNNRYWIMLNSWGTTPGRPDGLFMVSMDMNYSCIYSGLGYAYYWMTLEADFERPQQTNPEDEEMSGDPGAEAEKKIEEAKVQLDRARREADGLREKRRG